MLRNKYRLRRFVYAQQIEHKYGSTCDIREFIHFFGLFVFLFKTVDILLTLLIEEEHEKKLYSGNMDAVNNVIQLVYYTLATANDMFGSTDVMLKINDSSKLRLYRDAIYTAIAYPFCCFSLVLSCLFSVLLHLWEPTTWTVFFQANTLQHVQILAFFLINMDNKYTYRHYCCARGDVYPGAVFGGNFLFWVFIVSKIDYRWITPVFEEHQLLFIYFGLFVGNLLSYYVGRYMNERKWNYYTNILWDLQEKRYKKKGDPDSDAEYYCVEEIINNEF